MTWEAEIQGQRQHAAAQAAVALYTQALVWAPSSETLLSNRSAAYAAAGQFKAALEDAVKCEELAPTWPKAVYRRGVALRGLRRYDMAISAFAQGLEQDAWRAGDGNGYPNAGG
eukprot:Skav226099  [mRNA]  locus=scaffold4179:61728:62389:- [translate_table: standard]